MIARFARRLRRDARGAATIEFAMWAAFFFMGMLTAVDFGVWRTYQLRLASAVEQGAIAAFNARTSLDQTAATGIGTYVGAAAALPAPGQVSVTIGCNGGTANCVASNRTCACLSTTNGLTSFTPAASCNASCATGTTAGYYMTIRATYPYQAVVLPSAVLNGETMTDAVTVRLQ